MSGHSRRERKRQAKEPRSRTGRYYKRHKAGGDDEPALSSSSDSLIDEPFCPQQHTAGEDDEPALRSSSDASINEPFSPPHHSSPYNSGITDNKASLVDVSFPVSNIEVSFFADQGSDVNEPDASTMAQEEGFQSYCIIDPLPSDVGDFDDSQREIVDISDVLLSSDEGEVDLRDGDDDEIDQFFNYLSSENVSDNSSPSVSGVGQGAVSDDDDSGEFVNYCENQESPSFMEPDPQLAEVIKFLREWSAENSTALVALSKLAKGLKQTHPVCFYNLPVDGRTIMGTYVRKLDVKKVPPGEYIHTGIQEQLEFAASLIPEDVNSFPSSQNSAIE